MSDDIMDVLKRELRHKQEQKEELVAINDRHWDRIMLNSNKIVKLSSQIYNIRCCIRDREQ